MAYLRRAKARKGDTGKSPRNAKILLMIGNLLARIFPNYESRAMLKDNRDDWRADALSLQEKYKAEHLEAVKYRAKAEAMEREIEYLRRLVEKTVSKAGIGSTAQESK